MMICLVIEVFFTGYSCAVTLAPAKLLIGRPFGEMVMARAVVAVGVKVTPRCGRVSCRITPLSSVDKPVLTIQPIS